ncbi:MAG: glucose-6-phosphate isomerase [Alphaproteobacteria bacterium]
MLYTQTFKYQKRDIFNDPLFALTLEKINSICVEFQNQKKENKFPLLNIPYQSSDFVEIQEIASRIKDNFANLVIIGTGGSSLSSKALVNLNIYVNKIKIYYLENIDPIVTERFLNQINIEETAFLIVSKSGKTYETLSLLALTINKIKKEFSNYNFSKSFYFITDPTNNPIRNIGQSIGAVILNHDNIGGRFSAFTNVGLIAASVAGLDPTNIREGAKTVIDDLLNHKERSDISFGSAFVYSMHNHFQNLVMMAYSDQLIEFTNLYRQIWAESIGKGGFGLTPIPAIGTIDQHSQLQLYLDGPKDKIFTVIKNTAKGKGLKIDLIDSNEFLGNIANKTIGDIMAAEQDATIESLVKNNCPTRIIEMNDLGEHELGALIMKFMLETIIVSRLKDINPFDQPAVENNKILIEQNLCSV